jgi:hypothetical protein
MKILFFNDPMGTYFGDSAKEEAIYCKEFLQEWVFENKKFKFESTMNSMDLETKKYDILIFDFGGIGIGASGLVSSLSRQILYLIENKSDTLFIAWTSFTNQYLQDECEKELGDYPNLIYRDTKTEKVVDNIKKWILLGEN